MTARQAWSEAQIRELGTRTDIPAAGDILGGLSATQAYELAKRGGFPVPILQVGRRKIVPVAPILAALGLDAPAGGSGDRERPPDQGASGARDQAGHVAAAAGGVVRALRSGP